MSCEYVASGEAVLPATEAETLLVAKPPASFGLRGREHRLAGRDILALPRRIWKKS